MRKDSGLLIGTRWENGVDFKVFYFTYLSILEDDAISLLSVILWRNWFNRNRYVHDKGKKTDTKVVEWCRAFLADFRAANAAKEVCERLVPWVSPASTTDKIPLLNSADSRN
ncbi:hypothetical protein LWI28_026372 [Acer negundo]|uniref:Uncharacterized protein n=1 Tax=Acer negundo TaxID=4023 RepID=A0AAD5IS94_ACENE|nr:hypothetical protein LWI28_026372 [Acer negundo]